MITITRNRKHRRLAAKPAVWPHIPNFKFRGRGRKGLCMPIYLSVKPRFHVQLLHAIILGSGRGYRC